VTPNFICLRLSSEPNLRTPVLFPKKCFSPFSYVLRSQVIPPRGGLSPLNFTAGVLACPKSHLFAVLLSSDMIRYFDLMQTLTLKVAASVLTPCSVKASGFLYLNDRGPSTKVIAYKLRPAPLQLFVHLGNQPAHLRRKIVLVVFFQLVLGSRLFGVPVFLLCFNRRLLSFFSVALHSTTFEVFPLTRFPC